MEKLGVSGLDGILKGGIPDKAVVLIEGTPGIGKDILAYHFLFFGIKEKEACAIVFAGNKREEIICDFEAYGMKVEESSLVWIDASGKVAEKDIVGCNITELYTISVAIKKFLQENKKRKIRIVFGVLSHALMTNPPQEVYKFFSSIINELKNYNVTVMALIEEGMHDPQLVTAIEQLCDGVIDMKAFEKEWNIETALRVKKMRSLPIPLRYYHFKVTDKGIIVGE